MQNEATTQLVWGGVLGTISLLIAVVGFFIRDFMRRTEVNFKALNAHIEESVRILASALEKSGEVTMRLSEKIVRIDEQVADLNRIVKKEHHKNGGKYYGKS